MAAVYRVHPEGIIDYTDMSECRAYYIGDMDVKVIDETLNDLCSESAVQQITEDMLLAYCPRVHLHDGFKEYGSAKRLYTGLYTYLHDD
jgi:hypothetical protein